MFEHRHFTTPRPTLREIRVRRSHCLFPFDFLPTFQLKKPFVIHEPACANHPGFGNPELSSHLSERVPLKKPDSVAYSATCSLRD